jgi:hypothetical protein
MAGSRHLKKFHPPVIYGQSAGLRRPLAEAGVGMVFIVQGKPREPEGIVKVIRQTRKEALETANEFLNEGFPFVTIVGDGRVYTVKEFAMTLDQPE